MKTELKEMFVTTILHSSVYCLRRPGVYHYIWSTNHEKLNIILIYGKQRNPERVVEHMYIEDILIQISFYLVFWEKYVANSIKLMLT